ncbi:MULTISPECIES: hypothetical protein [unclassified Legionella]|uniref:hypothetical protein n=1 Tax=unclassified Legionella TaxID=2622702 RepID=UPI00105693D9|nr:MULTISPECIES: hypothetical protein [unclassified Legionella]MDI9818077.1 hypothetical protein [Legionella sp. PL877]
MTHWQLSKADQAALHEQKYATKLYYVIPKSGDRLLQSEQDEYPFFTAASRLMSSEEKPVHSTSREVTGSQWGCRLSD